MFKKIANRILLGYLIPLLAIGALAYTVWDTTKQAFKLEEEVTLIKKEVEESDEAIYDIARMVELTRAYVQFPKTQTYRSNYDKIYQTFAENANALQTDLKNSAQLDLAKTLVNEGENIHNLTEAIFKLVDENKLEQAKERSQWLGLETADRAHEELSEQLELSLEEKLKAFEQAEKQLLTITLIGATLSLLSVIGGEFDEAGEEASGGGGKGNWNRQAFASSKGLFRAFKVSEIEVELAFNQVRRKGQIGSAMIGQGEEILDEMRVSHDRSANVVIAVEQADIQNWIWVKARPQ